MHGPELFITVPHVITDKFDVLRGRLLGNHNDLLTRVRTGPQMEENLCRINIKTA